MRSSTDKIRQNIVVLTGAGISAESGLQTFRGGNGMWEDYKVEEVASIEAWNINPERVLEFYNKRRREIANAVPNSAHYAVAKLEEKYNVTVVTQNVDDLHEWAGSSNIIHLHGEITKARSENDDSFTTYDIGHNDLHIGDLAPDGGQLRPHIVWFGEKVMGMYRAAEAVKKADILIIIGTSLKVYPAAVLVDFAPRDCKVYLIDPEPIHLSIQNYEHIQKTATEGMEELFRILN